MGLGAILGGCGLEVWQSAIELDSPSRNEQTLVQHLKQRGAVLYGAYWCPYTLQQRSLFGAAAADLPYVECDPTGTRARTAECQARQITTYPTWDIGGKRYVGMQSLIELAILSDLNPLEPTGAGRNQSEND